MLDTLEFWPSANARIEQKNLQYNVYFDCKCNRGEITPKSLVYKTYLVTQLRKHDKMFLFLKIFIFPGIVRFLRIIRKQPYIKVHFFPTFVSQFVSELIDQFLSNFLCIMYTLRRDDKKTKKNWFSKKFFDICSIVGLLASGASNRRKPRKSNRVFIYSNDWT